MKHMMIDLETLSTRSDAAVIQIGACMFDIHTGKIGDTFLRNVDFDDAIKYGHVSGSTLKWWLQQSDRARRSITGGSAIEAEFACKAFHTYFTTHRNIRSVWSHGSFDVPILSNLFSKVGVTIPWHYRMPKDLRTLTSLTGLSKEELYDLCPPSAGVAHDALNDAMSMAQLASATYCYIKENGVG